MSRVLEQIGVWQQELLDLSNRNRLLNFRPSTTRPTSIQLVAPQCEVIFDNLIHGGSYLIIGNSASEEKAELEIVASENRDTESGGLEIGTPGERCTGTPKLNPGTSLSNLSRERVSRVALRLLRQARSSEQEQGINILFAAFGLLRWDESGGESSSAFSTQPRQAPLLLLPLVIQENASDGLFRITAFGEDVEFNQTLSERMKRDFGIQLPEDLNDDENLDQFFTRIRAVVGQRQGWDVLEQVHIGLFQFHKIRMFQDLSEHAALAADHDIVRALAQEGVTIANDSDDLPASGDFDAVFTPQESYSVLDADISQLGAIQAVNRGSHLLIEGPPGTGKSQTIANIVAECIAAGKKVLFVSEKAAAIEVVHRRLAQAGLGDFCLMLHSHKANKRDVLYDLAAQLEPTSTAPLTSDEELQLRRLQDVRARLNSYAEALHRRHTPMDVSAFWVHGELARLESLPLLLAPVPALEGLTLDTLDRWQSIVAQLSGFCAVLNEGDSHPWSGLKITHLGLADGGELRQSLLSLQETLDTIQAVSVELAASMALLAPSTLGSANELRQIVACFPDDIDLMPAWLDPARHGQIEAFAKEAFGRAEDLNTRANKLFETYKPEFIELATLESIGAYEQGFMARMFSGKYRETRRSLRLVANDGTPRSRDFELTSLRTAAQVRQEFSWFDEHREKIASDLGITAESSSLPDLEEYEHRLRGIAAASAILAVFDPDQPNAEFVIRACEPGIKATLERMLARLQAALNQIDESLARLTQFFHPDHLNIQGTEMVQVEMNQISAAIHTRLKRWNDLNDWIGSRLALQRVEAEGLRPLVDQLIAEDVPAHHWADVVRKVILTHWLDRLYSEESILREFRGHDHNDLIDRFKSLDNHFIDSGPRRLRQAVMNQRSSLAAVHAGEPGLLRHEAAKRRRHIPLRRLFARIPNLLLELKPCLMMSPLSVAQFLPADRYAFDVVIFDEASQVRPYDAIGAIIRGRQLVVAGDSKQLPPTNFFDRADDLELEEGEDLRALESILDGLRAKEMPSRSLLWHYRSRHEDLIAYSNHHFYDDRLITFPSPSAQSSPGKGVRLVYVPDGKYEQESDRVLNTARRVNRIEAKRVAQLVMDHARHRSSESLGVVTLGSSQRDIVDDEIRRARLLDQSCEGFFSEEVAEPFFVKALEQVQGDERDVIMISVGFGKNPKGILSHNFGPINRDGGERRLNVLVTRARYEVVVVSSIRGSDIDLGRTQRMGPRLLKNYLDFAEKGRAALEAPISAEDGEYESPFEESVGTALERLGYRIHRQVGASRYRIDLAIVHPEQPGRYLLGIECDGRTYHQSKTARDRDRLRQEVLEGLGWTIHRIWSTEWIRNRENELNRLVNRINEVLEDETRQASAPLMSMPQEQRTGAALELPLESPDNEKEPVNSARLSASPSLVEFSAGTYTIADIPVVEYGSILNAPMRTLVRAIVECVRREGPIHNDVLTRRIVTAWGHQRAGSRIASRLGEAILSAEREKRIVQKGDFLWPNGDHVAVPRGADEFGMLRDIKHIADEEILEAIEQVLRQTFSLPENELVFQTARFFGYQRTGADISRRLHHVLQKGLANGLLEFRGGRYTPSRK